MFALFASLVLTQERSQPIHTPYAQAEPLAIRAVVVTEPSIPRYGVEEIALDAGATFDNPFDPDDVALEATVVGPSGKATVVPGFFEESFTRTLQNGKEVLTPNGGPAWRLRICPTEEGAYKVTVRLTDRTGAVEATPVTFQATKSNDPGFVHVSDRDRHYFQFDSGKAYFPIGANMCWAGPRGTFDYDDWLPKYGAAGCNYGRLWLSPAWTTFGLEQTGKAEEGKGMGQFDLGNAWRLDQVLQKARANGLYMMLTIDSYNILRDRDASNYWEKSPQNRENGGPLLIWRQFWTDPDMDRLYRAKLRYLVARYGAYDNVLSWEFWNEVDLTRDYDPQRVQAWHVKMAEELHRIDPYHHLVTTSFSNSMGDRAIDLLQDMDYAQTHHYGGDLVWSIAYQEARKSSWGKPHLVAEVGADGGGPRPEDTQGFQVHNPIWISIATGCAGGAAPWWWDSLIEPNNLYPLFAAASRFVQDIDWPAEQFRPVDPALAYQVAPKSTIYGDLEFANGPSSFEPGPANRPRLVRIVDGQATGQLPLSSLLHGARNHRELRNPVTFRVRLSKPTRFDVIVEQVSGYGGAGLRISLDGKPVLTRKFADPDDTKDTKTITQYDGAYGFVVPKGSHTVLVENPGNDWLTAVYRFQGLVPQKAPAIETWALAGNRTAIAWLRAKGDTFHNVVEMKQPPALTPPAVLRLDSLAAGRWKVELWDTWRGQPIQTFSRDVENAGVIRIPIPSFHGDLAVKLKLDDGS